MATRWPPFRKPASAPSREAAVAPRILATSGCLSNRAPQQNRFPLRLAVLAEDADAPGDAWGDEASSSPPWIDPGQGERQGLSVVTVPGTARGDREGSGRRADAL